MLHRFTSKCKSFARNTSGNFAIIFAIGVSLIGICAGVTVSMVEITRAKTKLQNATDAAALAAVRFTVDDSNFTKKDREAIAKDIYFKNTSGINGAVSEPVINVEREGDILVSDISGSVKVNNFFAGFLSEEISTVNAISSSRSADAPKHTEIYFVVDNSTSMGIGQTEADQRNMVNDREVLNYGIRPCSVACHQSSEDSYTYYRGLNIRMRIDAMRDALVNFLEDVRRDSIVASNVKVSIATTGQRYNSANYDIYSNLDDAIDAAEDISLNTNGEFQYTNLSTALEAANNAISRVGDGSDANNPLVYVVLMTDGLEHFFKNDPEITYSSVSSDDPESSQRVFQTLAADECTKLKDRGVELLIMNTEYKVPKFRF